MDVQTVSLLGLIWTVNVSILELVSASQIPAVGHSVSIKVVVEAISSSAGTGTVDVCNMLSRKLSVRGFL